MRSFLLGAKTEVRDNPYVTDGLVFETPTEVDWTQDMDEILPSSYGAFTIDCIGSFPSSYGNQGFFFANRDQWTNGFWGTYGNSTSNWAVRDYYASRTLSGMSQREENGRILFAGSFSFDQSRNLRIWSGGVKLFDGAAIVAAYELTKVGAKAAFRSFKVRVYNRVLTDEEQVMNYRWNLANLPIA